VKAVILAGGLGTRLSEETSVKPKPMVEIGGMPVIWHIMKTYSHHGIDDFVVLGGYKSHAIKEYFANYATMSPTVRFDLGKGTTEILEGRSESWTVTIVDTGATTMTGGRLRRAREHLKDEPFLLTYGDGVSDVDIGKLVAQHERDGAMVTLTAVQPPGRFGAITLEAGQTRIGSFREKPEGDGAWINGGYFVVQPEALEYIAGDDISWEQEPLMRVANEGALGAYRHSGFWQPMDTLRDKHYLEGLWQGGSPPWKVWDR